MRITKIEITNYKSIKESVEINFYNGLPTVLIGKNGSGKTNILEALSAVAEANGNLFEESESGESKTDFAIKLLTDPKYEDFHIPTYIRDGLIWLNDQAKMPEKEAPVRQHKRLIHEDRKA